MVTEVASNEVVIDSIIVIKGILHYVEFPLYARRFLSDIVAT